MKLEIKDNTPEIEQDLKDSYAEYKSKLKLQIFRALTLMEASIKQNIRSGAGLRVRTGGLLNSISGTKRIYEEGNTVVGEIGSEGIPYAAIHEFGGRIVPKNKQFLTIPTEFNRRPDGLPRFSTADLMSMGNSFIAKNTIFMQQGKDKAVPMFWLKKSVEIPARPYLSTAFNKNKERIFKEFGLFIDAAFAPKKG